MWARSADGVASASAGLAASRCQLTYRDSLNPNAREANVATCFADARRCQSCRLERQRSVARIRRDACYYAPRAQRRDDYSGPDPTRIKSMFGSIAGRYDRANTIMSAGVHHLWRRAAVRWSGAKPGDAVLDCATGTGDLAIAFKKAVGNGRVVGTDFTPEMIELARRKSSDITFEVADVTALPFDDDSFDIASISFGIRNVGDPAQRDRGDGARGPSRRTRDRARVRAAVEPRRRARSTTPTAATSSPASAAPSPASATRTSISNRPRRAFRAATTSWR